MWNVKIIVENYLFQLYYKHNGGHYGQTVLYLWHQTSGHFSKKCNLCPHVQLQTVVWLFLWRFWSSGFFLAERPFRLCQYRTRYTLDKIYFCTCFLQHLHKVLCCCSGIDLPFSHQSTFNSRRHLPSPYWAVLRTIVCTDECGTFRHLKITPKDEPDLWRCTFFSEVLAYLFWVSQDVKRRGTGFEGRPWNKSTGTPPIDSNYVN
jgi:hypothetical protein